ncbi:oligosaccharide flippase family protein [Oceanithermus sp.]
MRLYRTKLAQESFWSLVIRVVYVSLSFTTTVILARALGAEGYGIYSYAYALALLLVIPLHTGLPNLVLRETAKGLAQNEPGFVKGVWQWAAIASAITVAVLAVVASPLVIWQGGYATPSGQALVSAFVLAPILASGNIVGASLRGMHYVLVGQLPEFIIRPTIYLLFIIIFLFFYKTYFSPALALNIYAIASALALLIGLRMVLSRMPPEVKLAKPLAKNSEWLSSSAFFALIAGLGIINDQASVIILGFFKNPDQVGLFRVAVQVARLASFGLQVANVVSAPRFAKLYATGKKVRLQKLATSVAQGALSLNILLTIIFIIFGKSFFNFVFGAEFSPAYLPLLILLAGQLVNSSVGSVAYLLNMSGHERETVWGMLFAASLNILLNLALVPEFGMIGAAVGSAVSMALWNVYLWWRVYKVMGVNSSFFGNASRRQ